MTTNTMLLNRCQARQCLIELWLDGTSRPLCRQRLAICVAHQEWNVVFRESRGQQLQHNDASHRVESKRCQMMRCLPLDAEAGKVDVDRGFETPDHVTWAGLQPQRLLVNQHEVDAMPRRVWCNMPESRGKFDFNSA